MTAPRTVTVPTIDRGDVTIPEPAWCVGHTDSPREYYVDLSHRGPEHLVGPAEAPLFVAMLAQNPHGSGGGQTGLLVETVHIARTMTPGELDELAAGLVESAAQLRHLARQLAALGTGGSESR
ncbi:DUF6907 domain-containing protein [Streptomyces sp. NPDC059909]|uniref:DUF6907 domain-containing protein n=1 Tax=Streptomyces sp. NPDC059909 TaxID=3346998 RepID=UPI003654D3B5